MVTLLTDSVGLAPRLGVRRIGVPVRPLLAFAVRRGLRRAPIAGITLDARKQPAGLGVTDRPGQRDACRDEPAMTARIARSLRWRAVAATLITVVITATLSLLPPEAAVAGATPLG